MLGLSLIDHYKIKPNFPKFRTQILGTEFIDLICETRPEQVDYRVGNPFNGDNHNHYLLSNYLQIVTHLDQTNLNNRVCSFYPVLPYYPDYLKKSEYLEAIFKITEPCLRYYLTDRSIIAVTEFDDVRLTKGLDFRKSQLGKRKRSSPPIRECKYLRHTREFQNEDNYLSGNEYQITSHPQWEFRMDWFQSVQGLAISFHNPSQRIVYTDNVKFTARDYRPDLEDVDEPYHRNNLIIGEIDLIDTELITLINQLTPYYIDKLRTDKIFRSKTFEVTPYLKNLIIKLWEPEKPHLLQGSGMAHLEKIHNKMISLRGNIKKSLTWKCRYYYNDYICPDKQ